MGSSPSPAGAERGEFRGVGLAEALPSMHGLQGVASVSSGDLGRKPVSPFEPSSTPKNPGRAPI